jgi:hypothetical protein
MKRLDDDVRAMDVHAMNVSPRTGRAVLFAAMLAVTAAPVSIAAHADEKGPAGNGGDDKPIVLKTQGSFAAGGTVVTNPGVFDPVALTPGGQTIHGDHAYVQYQVPVGARRHPIVMWHGGGQFTKTWETTPDGRDGFQNIFLRRGYATYLLDQPHRGRAGRATVNGTVVSGLVSHGRAWFRMEESGGVRNPGHLQKLPVRLASFPGGSLPASLPRGTGNLPKAPAAVA